MKFINVKAIHIKVKATYQYFEEPESGPEVKDTERVDEVEHDEQAQPERVNQRRQCNQLIVEEHEQTERPDQRQ